jgi:SAM-dependent methyltransferase
MADTTRPYCGNRVLEIGGGVGNLTLQLVPRWTFVVADANPLHVQTLKALRAERPYLGVSYCDVSDVSSFPKSPEGYDTVICLNSIEHVDDDREALHNLRSVLSAGGRAVVHVPQGQWNFGTLDELLGHKRRYSREQLAALAGASGFEVEKLIEFNRFGTIAWYINGRILRRRTFSRFQIRLLNLLVPFMRFYDRIAPTPPLSLIAILKPKA